jgi:hypothetical protein
LEMYSAISRNVCSAISMIIIRPSCLFIHLYC